MSQHAETFRPSEYTLADRATSDARMAFIRRTYTHLLGAIVAFILLEVGLFATGLAETLTETMLVSRYGWLVVLAAFMGVSYVADRWARSETEPATQYLGLGVYVLAEAIIFAPLLFVVAKVAGMPEIIPTAGVLTLVTFTGLTAVIFFTGKDFSFLGPALGIAGFVALGLIVASILFGFSLGIFFTGAMIAFACAYILYTTSNILHVYRTDQHVAAALALFAAVALLFWYIIRLLMILNRR